MGARGRKTRKCAFQSQQHPKKAPTPCAPPWAFYFFSGAPCACAAAVWPVFAKVQKHAKNAWPLKAQGLIRGGPAASEALTSSGRPRPPLPRTQPSTILSKRRQAKEPPGEGAARRAVLARALLEPVLSNPCRGPCTLHFASLGAPACWQKLFGLQSLQFLLPTHSLLPGHHRADHQPKHF
jgi:hypothetical protein